MPRSNARPWILLAGVLLLGCSEPRIDGSSEESFQVSYERVRDSLEGQEREAFEQAVLTLGMQGFRNHGTQDEAGATQALLTRLDGKNAAEVVLESREAPIADVSAAD